MDNKRREHRGARRAPVRARARRAPRARDMRARKKRLYNIKLGGGSRT